MRRVFETIFGLDWARIREYCAEEAAWARACAFLDANAGAGWARRPPPPPLCTPPSAAAPARTQICFEHPKERCARAQRTACQSLHAFGRIVQRVQGVPSCRAQSPAHFRSSGSHRVLRRSALPPRLPRHAAHPPNAACSASVSIAPGGRVRQVAWERPHRALRVGASGDAWTEVRARRGCWRRVCRPIRTRRTRRMC